jgi:hypothetical protein
MMRPGCAIQCNATRCSTRCGAYAVLTAHAATVDALLCAGRLCACGEQARHARRLRVRLAACQLAPAAAASATAQRVLSLRCSRRPCALIRRVPRVSFPCAGLPPQRSSARGLSRSAASPTRPPFALRSPSLATVFALPRLGGLGVVCMGRVHSKCVSEASCRPLARCTRARTQRRCDASPWPENPNP